MTETEVPMVVEAPSPPAALSAAVAWGTPKSLAEAIQLAKLVAESGVAPKDYANKPGAVLVAMQMGAEVGLGPMASVQNVAVINGRPSLWGDAVLAVVKAHRACEYVNESFDKATMTATCEAKRRGSKLVVWTFSQEDAKTAGLWGNAGPWTQYPKRMLQMRARGFACRDAFPDALRGLALAEELMDEPRSIDHQVVTPEPQGATATERLKNKMKAKKAEPAPAAHDRAALDARYNELVRMAAKGDEEKHAKILDDLDESMKAKHGVPVDGLDDEAMAKLVAHMEAQAK